MTCACLRTVDTKLGEQNLALAVAWTTEPFAMYPQVLTRWLDVDRAPRGKKTAPPPVICSFCPFCGEAVKPKAE